MVVNIKMEIDMEVKVVLAWVLGCVDVDDSGFQWGLGASYVMTETFSVFFDYVSLASDMESDAFLGNTPDVDSDALTLGVIYNF